MPTRGRHALAKKAIQCFIGQTYPDKELIVLDDIAEKSFPGGQSDMPRLANIIYLVDASRSIAEKRNLCCEHAFGDAICHIDSDDWSAPGRLQQQVEMLEASGKAVVGYCSMLFYDERDGKAWKFINYPNHGAIGSSLCYRREFWRSHRFTWSERYQPNCGEDGLFAEAAYRANELYSIDAGSQMVARIHSGSTSNHNLRADQVSYRSVPVESIPKEFFA